MEDMADIMRDSRAAIIALPAIAAMAAIPRASSVPPDIRPARAKADPTLLLRPEDKETDL